MIADAADAPVMVVHLTNRKAFEEVMRARMNGQKVYAETCPQYLLLDDSVYSKPDFEGAKYVCAPPIRKKADQDCLWKALANDQIQTVATDQCSFTMEQKALGKDDFTKIPGGCREYRREELCFIHTVYAQAGSRRNRCAVC